jgi:hypothetical protein
MLAKSAAVTTGDQTRMSSQQAKKLSRISDSLDTGA